MAHRHVIGVEFTGPDIEADGGHYHEFNGDQTSSDPDGPRHTHTLSDGTKTSGPVPMGPMNPDDHEMDAKSKKKKKSKKKWSY